MKKRKKHPAITLVPNDEKLKNDPAVQKWLKHTAYLILKEMKKRDKPQI